MKLSLRFFRFHLSTALIMMLVAGLLMSVFIPFLHLDSAPSLPTTGIPWDLSGTVFDLKSSAAQNASGCHVTISTWPYPLFKRSISISDASGEDIYTFDHFYDIPFVIKDHVIYYAVYGSISSGCQLFAFDLKKKGIVWKHRLQGLGPIGHSKYGNHVAMKLAGDQLIIYGNESAGKYIEVVDSKTGVSIANRTFDREPYFTPHLPVIPLMILVACFGIIVISIGAFWEWFIRRRVSKKELLLK